MFNLLMSGDDEAWNVQPVKWDRSRFLEYTEEGLRNRYRPLDDDAIAFVKSLPTLFTYEYGSSAGNPVRLGRITDMRAQPSYVYFKFEFYPGFELSSELFETKSGLLDVEGFEEHRTHWAIKNIDILSTGLFTAAPPAPPLSNKVFVVHGHDHELKDAVADLLREAGLDPVILHMQADRGRTVIEKFEQCANVGFAVVLLTPDDELEDGAMRARQNVILELGYFVGKLGRHRVCALKKGRLQMPSDIVGVLFKSVDQTGSWRNELVGELEAAGYDIRLRRRKKELWGE